MDSKINIHNFWRSHTFVILMFIIIAALSGVVFITSGFVNVETDMTFHLNRIYDLRESILNGILYPSFSLNGFNQSGSAAMSMYPKINLYPMVLLSFLLKTPSLWMYTAIILQNFVSLIIGYFSSYLYNNDKKISLIFSISYTVSTLFLFQIAAIGRMTAMIFLPLVLFGSLELLDNNKWIELAIGMIGLISCHVLMSIIELVFLIILFAINIRKFVDVDKLKSLFKAGFLTLSVSSISWIPVYILMTKSNVNSPSLGDNYVITGDGIKRFGASVVNHITPSITLAALVGLLWGFIQFNKLSRHCKQLFLIAVGFLFLCSLFFPWSLLNNTFIANVLQFPWRLFIIPEVILCYIFASLLVRFSNKISKGNIVLAAVIIVVIITQLMAQFQFVNSKVNRKSNNLYSNVQMKYFADKKGTGINDYYPKNELSDIKYTQHHISTYDGSKRLTTKALGNGEFSFQNKDNIKKLSLPFLYYNGVNYQVKLDGKTVKSYPNKNALMTINNIHKGKHHVQIIVHKAKAEIASYILSLIGLLILLGAILKNFIVKRKNK